MRMLIDTLDAVDISLGNSAYVGLAVINHLSGTLTTVTFQSLSGVDPDRNRDIGDVEVAGNVENMTGAPLVSTGDVTDIGLGSATLIGDLGDLGDADPAECYFEHREVSIESWRTTDSAELTSLGVFSVGADNLTRRCYYKIRAVANTADGDTARGSASTFNTPNPSSSKVPAHPGLDSVSHFGPSDGFAEAAPWLDDDTSIIVITEPTHRQLEKVVTIDGERLVVFGTSGTINLSMRDLPIPYDKCHIADQTTSSPGVTLVKGRVNIGASDCVPQHARARLGDADIEDAIEDWVPDTVNTVGKTMNDVIDHASASWSIDECLSAGYEIAEMTVSNCLIAETFDDPVHPKGEHGYGSLIDNDVKNVAMLGNVWAFNTDRYPRLKEGTQSVVVNNVMYDFEDSIWFDPDTEASIVGNACLRPDSNKANVFTEGDTDTAVAYLGDNLIDGDVVIVDENVTVVDGRPLWSDRLVAMSSGWTPDHNLVNVGARLADRTVTDERIFENVEGGESYLVDSQEQVGGYPDFPANSHELNVPNGGIHPRLWPWSRRVETLQR